MAQTILSLLVGAASLLSLPAHSADRLADFAWQAPISSSATAPYYRLSLPLDLYLNAEHANLADLRVFNHAGQPLPFARQVASSQSATQQHDTALPWFPLLAPAAGSNPTNAADWRISIKQAADGSLLELAQRSQSAPAANRRIGYVLDASKLPPGQALQYLELDWPSSEDGFHLLDVDSSDDLQTWQPLARGVQLARIDFMGQRLERRRIELPAKLGGRYLRLLWQQAPSAPILSAAHISSSATEWQAAALSWTGAIAAQAKSPLKLAPGEFHYRLPHTLPVSRLRISLPTGNVVLPFEILTPSNQGRAWRSVHNGLAYRIQQQSQTWLQDEIAVNAGPLSEIILRLDPRRLSAPAAAPSLQVGVQGDEIIFLAQGEGPYTLAIGNAQASTMASSLNSLLPNLGPLSQNAVAQALVAPRSQDSSKPAAMPQQPPGAAPNWQRLTLWALLIGAVLAMAWMARQLLRQLNNSEDPRED